MTNSDCKNILNLIPLYMDNVLSEEETNIVSRHLKTCESCKKELKFMNSIKNSTAALPGINPSADFHKTLMEKAEKMQKAKKARKFIILRRTGAGVAAAAVVALCLVNFTNINNNQKSTTPDEYTAPSSDVSETPVSLTAPLPEDISVPADNAAIAKPQPKTEKVEPASTEQAPTPPVEVPISGGGSSAKAPEYKTDTSIPSMLSIDETYTIATITVTDEIREAAMEILASYDQDEKGYKVVEINTVIRQLAELGATVETVCDNTISTNYIIIN